MVVDEGRDLSSALQRAAQEAGLSAQRVDVPAAELRAAVDEYRGLFRPQQLQRLDQQRRMALDAMQTFAELQPRLSGSLVHGDGPLDRIRLIVEADTPEQVLLLLSDRRIPWQEDEVSLQFAGNRRDPRPLFRFVAGDAQLELVVLGRTDRSNPPRDPLDKGPLAMLNADQLRALIDAR